MTTPKKPTINPIPVLLHSKGKGHHAVAAQLRVLIVPADGGGYVAQGLEIDYLATGASVEEVRENFSQGLMRTVEAYLRRGRSLDALFEKGHTPTEAWTMWLAGERQDKLTCATVVPLGVPENTAFFNQLAFRQATALAA